MNGAGHGLPGRSRNKAALAEELGGRSTNDFDSSEEAWTFLKRFSR
jgi:poly(3-hydroxybutyrate) depolymerase